jgi:lysozyme family protein
MADYKKLIPHILKWEGGWANDSVDKGGPTMKGITLNTYKSYCKMKGKSVPT